MRKIKSKRGALRKRARAPVRAISVVSRYPAYFADQPPIKFAKLQYTDFTAAAEIKEASINTIQWRANDVYDPQYAVGGHQPYGFDQLISMYEHFTVERSRLDVEIMNTGEYKNAGWISHLAAAPGEQAAAYAAGTLAAVVELPRSTKVAMCAVDVALARQRTISLEFDAASFFHKTLGQMIGNTPYSGTSAASPTEDAIFEVTSFSPSNAAVTFTLTAVKTTITYWVVFSEPKYFAPS